MTKLSDEIDQLLAESLLPSTMALLARSRKPIGVRALEFLERRGLQVHSLGGTSTGVITYKDERRGFLFVKLNRYARAQVPVWREGA